jgi:succinyl-diaminopimelate desuccinylase
MVIAPAAIPLSSDVIMSQGDHDPRADSNAGAELQLLQRLIRCRSVTPVDAGCQDIMAEQLDEIGFRCEAMPIGDVKNLWALRGSHGPLLCLAGHTDVVPPGPVERWQSDPFEPVVRNGNLYGRGAADMKGSLAAMLPALKRFIANYPDHPGRLAMLLTSDEEGPAIDGTARVIERLEERGIHINWCVLGEPSSQQSLGDTVRFGRRGSLSGILRVTGKQGHVAYPHLANNPIRRFAPVLNALNETTWDKGNEQFPPTTFEMVDISSGAGAANVIPGELSAQFNFRYSTEWTSETLREKVHSVFAQHDIAYELEWRLYGEPFITRQGKLTDAVSRAVREIAGGDPEYSTGGGTSDGRFIAPTGAEVVELGPVATSIHQVDEHVAVRDLHRLSLIYERIVELLLL